MPKRRRSDDEGGGPPISRESRRRYHLHLVVDDWTKGYSIYKVDVADLDSVEPDADLDSLATPLPGPPVFRLESCHANHSYPWFSSVGGKIAVMRYNEEEEDAPVLLYDTTTGASRPCEARFAVAFIPAGAGDGDRLYMMSTYMSYRGDDRFEVLAAATGAGGGRWAWNSVRTPPFSIGNVSCHAAHPDGRTIFFSVLGNGTYSFDTETQEWKRHGDWMLPFQSSSSGQVYYDAELDAWVGLDGTGVGIAEGFVRCCEVVHPTSGSGDHEGPPPAWKLAKERLVCEDWDRTKKVALTHMRPGKLCLVEQRFRKGVNRDVGDNVYLFYATTFKLRYDKDGGLRATARRTRSYTMPHELRGYHWSAFGP